MGDLEIWWRSLRDETRQRLSADPWAPVPPALWSDVTRDGVGVTGAYWPSASVGPDGFRMRDDVSEFMERNYSRHSLTYRGDPARVGLLAQMLREEGSEVHYAPPPERRDLASAAQDVVVGIITTGAIETIKRVIGKFHKRAHGTAEVTLEDESSRDV